MQVVDITLAEQASTKYYIPQNGTIETLRAQIQTDPHIITDQSVMITKGSRKENTSSA
jgi:hypothetical protein